MGVPKIPSEYENLNYLDHSWDLIYGPVESRRYGRSLGINLLGSQKACSFDCVYCELGRSELRMNQIKKDLNFADLGDLKKRLTERIRVLNAKEDTYFDSIVLSGNGEPTLYPHFYDAVEIIMAAQQELCPDAKVVALTNAAHLDNKKVVAGLNSLDERVVKVDAGNVQLFKRLNNPLIRGDLDKVLAGIRRLDDCVVQSMFIQGAIDNTRNEHIEEWIEVVGMIRPKSVQIYTLDRVPASSDLKKVDEDTLHVIASKLKRRTQIESIVFA